MLNTSIAPWPSFSDEEAKAATRVISSNRVNYWTGEEGRHFEREFAAWAGSSQAIAVANGTLALDLALKGVGVGHGDEVIVTPRTFIASASCVVTAGATPVFVDVDPDSGNITPATIEAALTPKTRAVIPVHLAGWPCDMPGIMEIAGRRGLSVIEDCAQAHGARIDGKSVGTFGAAGAWSFCQDKIMTTGGEGGMVTTNDAELWSRMWSYKDHGKSWDAVYNRSHPPGYRWVHESIGTNWRMLEVQSAIGRLQLAQMPEWTARRTANANAIRDALKPFGHAVRVPDPPSGMTHAYYRLYAYVRSEGLRPDWTRDRIVAEVVKLGVPLLHGTCSEVYLEKAFDGTSHRPINRLENARALGDTSLAFLTHPTLTASDMDCVCDAITKIFSIASK